MRRTLFAILAILLLILEYLPGCTIFQEENRAPIAVFSATPKAINVGEVVFFSANESRDKDGKIVKYSWDFGDGTYSLEKFSEHKYEKGGMFTVELIVKDDGGKMDRTNTTISVNNWPVAEGRAAKDPAKIFEVIQFDASDSSDRDGNITSYVWDFGDGSAESSGKAPTHKYSKIGTFNVSLRVTDDDKASADYAFKIRIVKRNYKIMWEESSKLLETISDWSNENETTNKTFKVSTHNLTQLQFNMTWNDLVPLIGPANDIFAFEVVSPDKDKKREETTTECITHKFKIDNRPDTMTMESESIETVRSTISKQYTSSKGSGEWLLSINCIDAGDWYLNVTETDTGNNWDIEIMAYYYWANIIEIG